MHNMTYIFHQDLSSLRKNQMRASCKHHPFNFKVAWNAVQQFLRSCAEKTVSVVYLILDFKNLKRGIIPRKKLTQNFLQTCTSTQYVLQNYKSWRWHRWLERWPCIRKVGSSNRSRDRYKSLKQVVIAPLLNVQ